jgi:hypothetical protein
MGARYCSSFRCRCRSHSTWLSIMTLLVVALSCTLLLSIPSAVLVAIAAGAQSKILFRGDVAIENPAGEMADGFYLLKTGKVTLESVSGQANPLFGWSWMFPPHLWRFTARAVVPTTAIFLHGPCSREYCEKNHSRGYEFLKRMNLMIYQRMRPARNRTLAICHRSETLR